ncbi:hypothetical protein QEN19_002612 [Hanseniaspora menglaensis]
MSKIDYLLDQLENDFTENLAHEIKQFLIGTFYNKDLNKTYLKHKNAKKNALKNVSMIYNSEDDNPLKFYEDSIKYYNLIEAYLEKKNDYLPFKNIIFIYLNHEDNIHIKTLGLRLLKKYVEQTDMEIISTDELLTIFVPIIIEYFHFIPPHFKIEESMNIVSELFSLFDLMFEKRLKDQRFTNIKHNLILQIYSENVISLMIPSLLLSKHENSPLLSLILKKLVTEYISNGKYFVNIIKLLNLFKPLIEFPDYMNIIKADIVKIILEALQYMPLLDETENDFFKFNIISYYILFLKFYVTAENEATMAVFYKNLNNRYGNCDSDIDLIMASI